MPDPRLAKETPMTLHNDRMTYGHKQHSHEQEVAETQKKTIGHVASLLTLLMLNLSTREDLR